MPRTILYFLDDPSRDKHFHHYVLTGLKEAGYNPIVVYFWMEQQKSYLKKMGHNIINLGFTRDSYRRFNPGLVFKIRAAIIENNAVAIHSQRHHSLIYMAAASYLTRISAFFYTIRSINIIRTFNRKLSFYFSNKRIDKVIAVSCGVRDDFIKRSGSTKEKVEVIYNGIDPSAYEYKIDKKEARKAFNLPVDTFLFGMAARFMKAKDHKGLIDAFSRIKKNGSECSLVLAGDGPLEEEIKAFVKITGLNNDVIFLGKIDPEKIFLFLKALDVFVHPSVREGMPAAVLEAMASKLPVIATDAAGITDIFDTPHTFGRMLPRGDIDMLASAMLDFYHASPEKLDNMGQKAQDRVYEAFTHKHMVEKTIALYDRFVGSG